MCTLIIGSRVTVGAPLVVAANRDEQVDRPSVAPALVTDGPIPFLAPKDLKAQGTWLGVNASGLFAGITNRFGVPPDPARRSRGQLVKEALGQASAAAAFLRLRQVEPAQFNRFHLVLADQRQLFLIWSDGQSLHDQELGPGIHVVTERSLREEPSGREQWLKKRLANLPQQALLEPSSLADIMKVHEQDSFEGTCVHLPEWNYGTRCSTLIWLYQDAQSPQGVRVRLLHAEGPPCQNPYEDYSSLLPSSICSNPNPDSTLP